MSFQPISQADSRATHQNSQTLMPLFPLQANLTLGQSGDVYEQEADRVASQVMGLSAAGYPTVQHHRGTGWGIQRSPITTHAHPNREQTLGGRGDRPLPKDVRSFMEPRFKADFSRVRVHTDRQAVQMNQALGAQAFTHSHHIYFGAGTVPRNDRLMAHELTHVMQQTHGMQPNHNRVQCQLKSATPAEITEFGQDRQRFEAAQDDFFAEIGQSIQQHILQTAGFTPGQTLSTAEDALKVVQLWGMTLKTLTGALPQVTQSLAGQVQGQQTNQGMQQQQQALMAALSPDGQKAFQAMLQRVRSENFWRQHLDSHEIYIFPDLSGSNRYAGYTQRGQYQTPEGLTQTAYIIHISKDRLNNGEVEAAAATLVHELSHSLHEPNVTARSLQSLTQQLANLLADHPQILALRQGAPDPEQARQLHVRRIHQILFEHTGYAEAEIFVHLQQLTHQPSVQIQGDTEQPHHYILAVVEGYVSRLKKIGMPPAMLAGIMRSLKRRVDLLYQRRIAASPEASTQRKVLQLSRDQALTILDIAASD